jgi:hypothetical protein
MLAASTVADAEDMFGHDSDVELDDPGAPFSVVFGVVCASAAETVADD